MQITLKFTDSHARDILYFLRKRYSKSKNAKLEGLAKIAILTEVANQARDEYESKQSELALKPSDGEWYIEVTGSRSGIQIDTDERGIAVVKLKVESSSWGDEAMFKPENAECLANAKLIAAAPIMRNALKVAQDALKALIYQHPDDEIAKAQIGVINEALAKAEAK